MVVEHELRQDSISEVHKVALCRQLTRRILGVGDVGSGVAVRAGAVAHETVAPLATAQRSSTKPIGIKEASWVAATVSTATMSRMGALLEKGGPSVKLE